MHLTSKDKLKKINPLIMVSVINKGVSFKIMFKQPPENICQTGFWQTRLVLLVNLEASNDLIYII